MDCSTFDLSPTHPIESFIKNFKSFNIPEILEMTDIITELAWERLKLNDNDKTLLNEKTPIKIAYYDPNQSARMIWALVSIKKTTKTCFELQEKIKISLSKLIENQLQNFSSKQLIDIACAFDNISHWDIPLFNQLGEKILKAKVLDSHDIAWAAYAFRKIASTTLEKEKRIDRNFYIQFYENLIRRIKFSDLSPEKITIIAKSFTQAKIWDSEFFKNLSLEVEKKINNFKVIDLAYTAWAYADVKWRDDKLNVFFEDVSQRIKNSQEFNQKILKLVKEVILKKINFLDVEQISRIVHAVANLGDTSKTFFNAILRRIVAHEINYLKPQDLINITQVLIGVKCCSNNRKDWELIRILLNQVLEHNAQMERGRLEGWKDFDLSVINCIFLFYHLKTRDSIALPETLKKQIKDHLANLKKPNNSSDLHRDVAKHLQEILPGFENEYCVEGYFIDIAYPQRKIAIEVDGPLHLEGKGGRLKDALLNLLGWDVIRIPYYDWQEIKDLAESSYSEKENKLEYLENRLQELDAKRAKR